MCNCIKTTHLVAGWICHGCRVYNGLQRDTCRSCEGKRCKPLSPDSETGECFETYAQAYADDPDMLERVKSALRSN